MPFFVSVKKKIRADNLLGSFFFSGLPGINLANPDLEYTLPEHHLI